MTRTRYNLLLCRIGSHVCGVPLEHVVETFRPLPIQPLTGAPQLVRGLSIVRGVAVPVVDVAMLLQGVASSGFDRFVSVRSGDRVIVLATGAVIGVHTLEASDAEDLPPLLDKAAVPFVDSIHTLHADLLVVLRASRILSEEVWRALRVEGAA